MDASAATLDSPVVPDPAAAPGDGATPSPESSTEERLGAGAVASADTGPLGLDASAAPGSVALADPVLIGQYPLAGMSVLLVDRARHSRTVLQDLVTDLGAREVISAETMAETVTLLELRAVHLVISENLLEDGGSAQALLERLRERRLLPLASMFVVVSADRSSKSVASVAEFGADAYLIKPIVPQEVRSRLARASHRKRLLFPMYQALDNGAVEEAVRHARRISADHASLHSEAFRLTTAALASLNRVDDAMALTREALSVKHYAWALLRLAELRFASESYVDAARTLERLIERHPDHLAAYQLLARVRERLGDYQAALDSLDEVADRANPTAARLRSTGALARKVGNLERAESSLRELVQRNGDNELTGNEDALALVQVLIAQGKTAQAEKLAAERERRSGGHADAALLQTMLQFGKARDRGDRPMQERCMVQIAVTVEDAPAEVSLQLVLQALESCVEAGLREQGYRISVALVRSRRVDRASLHVLRALVDRLGATPKNLIAKERLEVALEQLKVEGWDHHLGPAIAESLDYWRQREPADAVLKGQQERLVALARNFGISHLG